MKFSPLMLVLISLMSIVCLLQNAQGGQSQPGQNGTDTQSQEDDIREVIFRHLFGHNASGQQKNGAVYFLSLGKDKYPSKEFLARFKEHKPIVKSEKDSIIKDGGVVDKQSGKSGLRFSVEQVKWINEKQIEAYGTYYEGNLSSAGYTYQLAKENGKWVVIKQTMNLIS